MALLAACIFSGCSSKTEATVKGDTIRHEFKTFVYSDSTDYELDLDNGQIKYVSAKYELPINIYSELGDCYPSRAWIC